MSSLLGHFSVLEGHFITVQYRTLTIETFTLSSTYFASASRWKDASSGQHVDYDQRPDVFRCIKCLHSFNFFKSLKASAS